ncbi:hypothetical protein Tco_1133243 [Tanacetum coccineum]
MILNDVMKVVKQVDLNKHVVESDNELESDIEDVLLKVEDPDVVIEEVTGCMKIPRATLYEHNETPGGSIYWQPHIEGILIPVEGTYFDTLDEAIDMYTSYTEIRGFEVKKSGQRKTKSGISKRYNMVFVPFTGVDNHDTVTRRITSIPKKLVQRIQRKGERRRRHQLLMFWKQF